MCHAAGQPVNQQQAWHKVPFPENNARVRVVDSPVQNAYVYCLEHVDLANSWHAECFYLTRGREMPYLRVHSQALPIDQKRVVAQKLIEITLAAFRLRAEERSQITIQFISQPSASGSDLNDADFTLEVLGHGLTEEKKAAFTEETAGIISDVLPIKPRGLIARLLGAKADTHRQIALQFHELSPAISDPFVVHPLRRAA